MEVDGPKKCWIYPSHRWGAFDRTAKHRQTEGRSRMWIMRSYKRTSMRIASWHKKGEEMSRRRPIKFDWKMYYKKKGFIGKVLIPSLVILLVHSKNRSRTFQVFSWSLSSSSSPYLRSYFIKNLKCIVVEERLQHFKSSSQGQTH